MTDLEFLEYLKQCHRGKMMAENERAIASTFGLSSREVRDICNALRKQGHPICFGNAGIWYGTYDEAIVPLEKKTFDMLEQINALKRKRDEQRQEYRQGVLI